MAQAFSTVLQAVRHNARSWWYHVELRQQGQQDEARRREHQSCRRQLESLRAARHNEGYAVRGCSGNFVLYFEPNARLENAHPGTAAAVQLAGVPIADLGKCTTAAALTLVMSGPMARVGTPDADLATAGAFSDVSVRQWLALAERAGATIINRPAELPDVSASPMARKLDAARGLATAGEG